MPFFGCVSWVWALGACCRAFLFLILLALGFLGQDLRCRVRPLPARKDWPQCGHRGLGRAVLWTPTCGPPPWLGTTSPGLGTSWSFGSDWLSLLDALKVGGLRRHFKVLQPTIDPLPPRGNHLHLHVNTGSSPLPGHESPYHTMFPDIQHETTRRTTM